MKIFLRSLLLVASAYYVGVAARAHAAPAAPGFTLDGVLYDSPGGGQPLLDTVNLRVQILDSSKTCVLYDQRQSVNTSSSEGAFSVAVGSDPASGLRTPAEDPGLAMAAIYQNGRPLTGTSLGGGSSCAYTPAAGSSRYVRVTITPSGGSPEVLSPDLALGSVPTALVAETLQGYGLSDFLRLGTGSLSQTNVENVFSTVNYPKLTALLAGSGVTSSGSSTSGGYTVNADSDSSGGDGLIDFQVRGASRLAITNGGSIGVGTTAPATQFANTNATAADAAGVATAASGISWLSGAAGYVQSLVNSSTAGTANGLLVKTAGGANSNKVLTLSAGAADVFTVTGAGHVGINTTTPAEALHVVGDIYSSGNIGGSFFHLNTSQSTLNAASSFKVNLDYDNNETGQAFIVGASSSNQSWQTTGELFRVQQNGNVGIGTFAPDWKLKIEDPANAFVAMNNATGNTSTYAGFRLQVAGKDRYTVALDNSGNQIYSRFDSGGNYLNNVLNLAADGSIGLGGNMSGSSTTGAAMLVGSGGNVGIGTTNPAAKLHVANAGDTSISIDSGAASRAAQIEIHRGGGLDSWIGPSQFNSFDIATAEAIPFTFSNDNYAERLRISATGNVGIGSSAPNERLDVSGNALVSGQLVTGTTTITGGTNAINWNSGNSISTDYDCASAISLANLRDGGTYTLAITGAGTAQCTFNTSVTGNGAGTVSYRFRPLNSMRTAASHTLYTFTRMGGVVYVSWASGF